MFGSVANAGDDANLAVPVSRKRKREEEVVDSSNSLSDKKRQNVTGTTTIDDLPRDVLKSILSGFGLKEAARASVLSRKWKDLWKFSRSLRFDAWDTRDSTHMTTESFNAWVNHVLFHHASEVDNFLLHFDLDPKQSDVDTWICHALLYKQPKHFDVSLRADYEYYSREYKFPSLLLLNKINTCVPAPAPAFASLMSLKLSGVNIEDAMVHSFLASCVNLESLSICNSYSMKNLQFVDPLPKLKLLEICDCFKLESLEISVATLISCVYKGPNVDYPFKNVPNLSEVTLGKGFCKSFLYEGDKHLSYYLQLERLHLDLSLRRLQIGSMYEDLEPPNFPSYESLKKLEVETMSLVGRSLLFFTMLIRACPLLHEFRIKIDYQLDPKQRYEIQAMLLFPEVGKESPIFHHENLKLVEFGGYIGCSTEQEFLGGFAKIAPSLEVLIIDTRGDQFELAPIYAPRVKTAGKLARGLLPIYDRFLEYTFAKSRSEAREHAQQLRFKFPPETQLTII